MIGHTNTIYIIGAGAIGKVLAVFLKITNKNVVIIRGSIDKTEIKPSIIKSVPRILLIQFNPNYFQNLPVIHSSTY